MSFLKCRCWRTDPLAVSCLHKFHAIFSFFNLIFTYFCVFISMYVFLCVGARRKQMFNVLELELQTLVNCLTEVLRTESWSSERAGHSLNYWAFSPTVFFFFWNIVLLEFILHTSNLLKYLKLNLKICKILIIVF